MVLNLLNNSFAEETMPRIDDIIGGFPAEKHTFIPTYTLEGCVAIGDNYPLNPLATVHFQAEINIFRVPSKSAHGRI